MPFIAAAVPQKQSAEVRLIDCTHEQLYLKVSA